MRNEISNILKECKYYSIIADEVRNTFANKEVLLLCISYFNNLKEEPTGKIIGSHILGMLKIYKIDVKNCRKNETAANKNETE